MPQPQNSADSTTTTTTTRSASMSSNTSRGDARPVVRAAVDANVGAVDANVGSADALVGDSGAAQRLRQMLVALGRRECTVLVLGESGTGKELAARTIHAASSRAAGPFVPVDCTTLRDTLFESQLFGHVRGAFTGADRSTLGFFRTADRGTLFLDEIGELAPPVQAKLLRCIQDSAVVPLGGVAPLRVDVRIVAATHRDLGEMMKSGLFRQDLYYRLNVAQVCVPPLRERREDVPMLARHAAIELARLYHEPPRELSDDAIEMLSRYDWPGNVRELINAVEHALVFSTGERLEPQDLPDAVRAAARPTTSPTDDATGTDATMTMEAAERRAVARALEAAGGNQTRAAKLLAIERHRLHRIVKRFDLAHLVRPRGR
jgi:two-component system response regulator HydG